LIELKIPQEIMKIEVRYIENNQKQKTLKEVHKHLRDLDIRFRKLNKNSLTKKPLFTLRVSSRLIRDLLKNLEMHFISNHRITKENW